MNQDVYLPLIYRSLEGTLSERERQQLDAWLTDKPEHRRIRDEVARSWELEKSYEPDIQVDVKGDFQLLRQRIATAEKQGKPPPKVRTLRPVRRYLALAASIALVLAAAWWLLPKGDVPPTLLTIQTGADERREVVLPDGSAVWLNGNSELNYPVQFSTLERQVQLQGEAYFDVQSNPAQPFRIQTKHGLEVEVLGTQFNLYTPTAAATTLQVSEGSVAIRQLAAQAERIVKANQAVAWDADENSFQSVALSPNRDAWKTGNLRFDNVPLATALVDAEALFAVQFELTNSALEDCLLTSFLPAATLETFLAALADTFQLSWQKEGDTYILTGGQCG